MESTNLQMILNYVTGFLGSATGLAILTAIVKIIANAVVGRAKAKSAKLSKADKDEIAELVADKMQIKLNLDANAMVEKATNARLVKVEEMYNQMAEKLDYIGGVVTAEGSAIATFKTISNDSRQQLNESLKGTQTEIVKVDTTVPEVVITKVETNEETSKVTY